MPIDVVIKRQRTQRSQVVKQADVAALIALLPEAFPGELAERNFRYYEPKCAHGSSLSTSMHGLVAARLGDAEMALRYLHKTAALDLDPDPNSAGGVRIAGLGGMWQTLILGFAGVNLMGDTLAISPKLPREWRSLSFRVCWKRAGCGNPHCRQYRAGGLDRGQGDGRRDSRGCAQIDGGNHAANIYLGSASLAIVPRNGVLGRPRVYTL